MEEDWDLLRQIQEIDFNTSEYEDQCKNKMSECKDVPKEKKDTPPEPKDEPLPTLAELRRLRLAKFSPCQVHSSSDPSR
jgi:hypothetical protein